MERLIGIGEAAQALGVSITTLRRWEATGKLSAIHTAGGHRRYDLAKLKPEMSHAAAQAERSTIAYARIFASSKTCSSCGHKLDELSLSIRQWTCPVCGAAHDRDVNAACNLRNMAVSSTVSACGEESAGLGRKTQVKLASTKQEVSSKSV